MATIDQQFVEYIVKTLVNNPEQVVVERQIDEKGVLLSLTVAPEDVGRIIGKRGVTAQALRVLLRALGTKQDARFNLKIVNNDEEGTAVKSDSGSSSEEHPQSLRGRSEEPREDGSEDRPEEDGSEVAADKESVESDDPKTSELAEKTRAELADLDDLDI